MRVLIDACLPVEFKEHLRLPGSKTAREMGWHRLKNGELLAAAAGKFDVLVTSKSTLLKILTRITEPTEGRVRIAYLRIWQIVAGLAAVQLMRYSC